MSPLDIDAVAPGSDTESTSGAGRSPRADIFDRVRDVQRICRQVFGIPDYERYLAHAAARHPGAPVLSRREFCARAIERKYGSNGPRCC